MYGKIALRVFVPALLIPLLFAGSEKSSAQLDSTKIRNAPTTVLFIYGNVARPVAISTSLIQAMPQVQVKTMNGTETYSGAALKDLLARAGISGDAEIPGKIPSLTIAAVSKDGSSVELSGVEAGAVFHDGSQVIVADAMNGKPLDASNGPLMLIVSGDKEPTHSIRNLTRIKISTAK